MKNEEQQIYSEMSSVLFCDEKRVWQSDFSVWKVTIWERFLWQNEYGSSQRSWTSQLSKKCKPKASFSNKFIYNIMSSIFDLTWVYCVSVCFIKWNILLYFLLGVYIYKKVELRRGEWEERGIHVLLITHPQVYFNIVIKSRSFLKFWKL